MKAAGKPQTTDGKKKFEEFMKMKEEKIKKHFGLAISNVDSNKDEVEIIVDTGAQPSIIKDKGLLSNLITKSSTLHQVNGSVKSVGKGDFIVKNDLPPLQNSIFVPNSSYNLLSVGQMSDSWNCSTVFDSDGFRTIQGQIRIPDEKLILEGERSKDGLYKVRKLQKKKEKPVKNDEQSERTQNLKIGAYLSQNRVPIIKPEFSAPNSTGDAKIDLEISRLKADILEELLSAIKSPTKPEIFTSPQDGSRDNRPCSIQACTENSKSSHSGGDSM